MKLKLERPENPQGDCTIGELFIDSIPECFSLEDKVREIEGQPVEAWKVKGQTAIPVGTYPVTITYSNRFKRDLPLVGQVPGFEGIRIHPGNTAEDTEGCLLVGRTKTDKAVGESRAAFNQLFDKIKSALDSGDTVSIEIE